MPVRRGRERQPHRRMVLLAPRWRSIVPDGGGRLGASVADLLATAQVRPVKEDTRLRIEATVIGGIMALAALSALLGWLG